ncbi:uncharacterized protein SCHCODRAFT_02497889 [Schizophyllum commune H4-8]|uniref:uncharacterized protein n=1 Tax=Schizophyllum commune (strain H4-8 / FGSC 9210) TaxID=578458 RepID=UPI00215E186D|nr:uncharacterized protein SCHCODRAFT_02497889 [Schizophyllum commune H4-8]KAI5893344.1 hypothetical protein SCHCODRAFT_02497889 [Schizophyllum commune H4-8]
MSKPEDGQVLPAPSAAANTSKKRPRQSLLFTPRKRSHKHSSIGTTQRRNVDERVKKLWGVPSTFCVVTLASEHVTYLEYAHLVERATDPDILTKLEWSWGMQYQAFNVHTSLNIHPLDVVLRKLFDRTEGQKHNGWFWLPVMDNVILQMCRAYTGSPTAGATPNYPSARRKPQEFYLGNKKFAYTLIPFPAMDGTRPISVFPEVVSKCNPHTPMDNYHYPFDLLPNRSLHVPYHLVICNTGRKLFGFYDRCRPTEAYLKRDFPSLAPRDCRRVLDVWDIYDAWMHAVPTTEWQDDPAGDGHGRAGSSYAREIGDGDDRSGEEQQQRWQGSGGSGTGSGYRTPPGRAPPSDEESASWSGVGEGESGEDEPEDEGEIEYGPSIETWATDVWESMQEEEMAPSPFDETFTVAAPGTLDL